MKKLFLILLPAVLLLCGCGDSGDTADAVVEQELPPVTDYVLSDESPEEILALAELPELCSVDGSASREYEALLKLYELRPDCDIKWVYRFDGSSYPSDTRLIRVTGTEGLEDALRFLPLLETVDLTESTASLEDLDRYSEIRPDVFYDWFFEFNGTLIRTDIECFSTLRTSENHRFTSEELYPLLKYCTRLRALDLGHNNLTDISLIGRLSELEVLILADNPELTDLSPLGNLSKLFYLELFMCPKAEDFSFLSSLENMRALNLCYCRKLDSMDYLEHMPDIEFLMLRFTDIDREDFKYWSENLPQAKLVYYGRSASSCGYGWRDTDMNHAIRHNFSHWRNIVSYNSYDDVIFDFENPTYEKVK